MLTKRLIPAACTNPPDASTLQPRWAASSYEILVQTPFIGGGVRPRFPDDVTAFRIPSVRGHLRFWWRAVRGCDCTDAAALREREGHIWGSTEKPSPIVLRALQSGHQPPVPALKEVRGRDGRPRLEPMEPSYALFPLQQRQEKEDARGKITPGGVLRFEATFRESGAEDEFQAALWAWINFGGYGARTRRGAGALYCRGCSPDGANGGPDAVLTWLKAHMNRWAPPDLTPRAWPTLRGAEVLIENRIREPKEAWIECVRIYREFRQRRSPSPRGRSCWPEPDQIRRDRKRWLAPYHAPVHPQHDYPRAILGLPIVFHFKDAGDPYDQSLEPATPDDEGGRLASPVILKPLLVAPNQARAMVLRLNTDLFVTDTSANQKLSGLMLKQIGKAPPAPTLKVSRGSRRADDEFLAEVAKIWKVPRTSL